MRKNILNLIFAVFSACFIQAQQNINLFPYVLKGKYGFADSTGKLIVKPDFEFAGPFYDGMAMVKKNGMFGFVNAKGKTVIATKIAYAENFRNGLAKIKAGNADIFIDKEGNDASPAKKRQANEENLKKKFGKKYDRMVDLENGLCLAIKDTAVILLKPNGLKKNTSEELKTLQACLDYKGNVVIPMRLWNISAITATLLYVSAEKDAYVYSNSGTIVLNKVQSVECLEYGDKLLRTFSGYVYLDSVHDKIISLKSDYSSVKNFKGAFAKFSAFRKDKLYYGILKRDGSELFPPKYLFIGELSGGKMVAQDYKGMYGLLDTSGKNPVPFEYDFISTGSQGLFLARKTGVWSFIDGAGKEKVHTSGGYPFPFDDTNFLPFKNGVYAQGEEFGFSEGLSVFYLNGKFGYMDVNGKAVIEPVYIFAEPFRNGIAAVYELNEDVHTLAQVEKLKLKYIDKTGKEVFSVIPELSVKELAQTLPGPGTRFAIYFSTCSFLNDGTGKWKMLGTDGKSVALQVFSSVSTDSWLNGKFMWVTPEGGQPCMIRSDGKLFEEK